MNDLTEEQKRREVFRRAHVARWEDPSVTVGGPGSNGPYGVADPRVSSAFPAAYGVNEWQKPTGAIISESNVPIGRFGVADPRLNLGASGHTNILHVGKWAGSSRAVTGSTRPSSGAPSVADPRLGCAPHSGAYGVNGWTDPANTITGAGQVDNARQAVADPRAEGFRGMLGVVPWDVESGTITGGSRVGNGSFAVADPRVPRAFDKGYAVVDWSSSVNTVAGDQSPGCGTYSVADPRTQAPAGWLSMDDMMVFLETPGPWAIVDRSSDGPPLAIITDLKKPSPFPVRIVARDGTWHRPFTALEVGCLQGLPAVLRGAPLQLSGPTTTDRKQIGNLVPPPAAMAIADRMLIALGEGALGVFSLSGAGGVWVDSIEEGSAVQ